MASPDVSSSGAKGPGNGIEAQQLDSDHPSGAHSVQTPQIAGAPRIREAHRSELDEGGEVETGSLVTPNSPGRGLPGRPARPASPAQPAAFSERSPAEEQNQPANASTSGEEIEISLATQEDSFRSKDTGATTVEATKEEAEIIVPTRILSPGFPFQGENVSSEDTSNAGDHDADPDEVGVVWERVEQPEGREIDRGERDEIPQREDLLSVRGEAQLAVEDSGVVAGDTDKSPAPERSGKVNSFGLSIEEVERRAKITERFAGGQDAFYWQQLLKQMKKEAEPGNEVATQHVVEEETAEKADQLPAAEQVGEENAQDVTDPLQERRRRFFGIQAAMYQDGFSAEEYRRERQAATRNGGETIEQIAERYMQEHAGEMPVNQVQGPALKPVKESKPDEQNAPEIQIADSAAETATFGGIIAEQVARQVEALKKQIVPYTGGAPEFVVKVAQQEQVAEEQVDAQPAIEVQQVTQQEEEVKTSIRARVAAFVKAHEVEKEKLVHVAQIAGTVSLVVAIFPVALTIAVVKLILEQRQKQKTDTVPRERKRQRRQKLPGPGLPINSDGPYRVYGSDSWDPGTSERFRTREQALDHMRRKRGEKKPRKNKPIGWL